MGQERLVMDLGTYYNAYAEQTQLDLGIAAYRLPEQDIADMPGCFLYADMYYAEVWVSITNGLQNMLAAAVAHADRRHTSVESES